MHSYIMRSARLFAVPLLLAGVGAGVAPAAAARTESLGTVVYVHNQLDGVAATSASNAWVVGCTHCFTSKGKALIEHWNGTAWKQVPSPAPAGSVLDGVAASSASDAWAVGSTGTKTLILRWNGTAWKQVPSPGGSLSGVAATSASNAWAVGYAGNGKTLIVRWNGAAWKQVPSPGPANSLLDGVAATSASSAWAVGYPHRGGTKTLILRWNGTPGSRCPARAAASPAWPRPPSVAPGRSATRIKTLILRWNGTAWKQVPSPSPGGGGLGNILFGVAVTSASSAWAVGEISCGCGPGISLILRWNGTAWKRVPSPTPGGGTNLRGVVATSARNAWAAG